MPEGTRLLTAAAWRLDVEGSRRGQQPTAGRTTASRILGPRRPPPTVDRKREIRHTRASLTPFPHIRGCRRAGRLPYAPAMRPSTGMTLIELIIVLAIAGIALGIGVTRIDSRGAATRQAAQVLAASINQARFEAVRSNRTSGIVFVADDGVESGLLRICRDIDDSTTLECSAADAFHVVRFSSGELARARIASPATLSIFFDRRGIVRNPGSATVTITDRSGGNVRTVSVLPTGRAEVQ